MLWSFEDPVACLKAPFSRIRAPLHFSCSANRSAEAWEWPPTETALPGCPGGGCPVGEVRQRQGQSQRKIRPKHWCWLGFLFWKAGGWTGPTASRSQQCGFLLSPFWFRESAAPSCRAAPSQGLTGGLWFSAQPTRRRSDAQEWRWLPQRFPFSLENCI